MGTCLNGHRCLSKRLLTQVRHELLIQNDLPAARCEVKSRPRLAAHTQSRLSLLKPFCPPEYTLLRHPAVPHQIACSPHTPCGLGNQVLAF